MLPVVMDAVNTAAYLTGAQRGLELQNAQISLLKQQTANRDSFLNMVMEQAQAVAQSPVGTGALLNQRA